MSSITTAPQTKYRKDYKQPDFRVESIYLDFILREGASTIRTKTAYTRTNKTAKDLTLDGHKLTLKSVTLDGTILSESRYTATDENLTVTNVPDSFTLEIETEARPAENTSLEGLYQSSGNYCTQCEPHGFSQFTYYLDRPDVLTTFTTRIEADKAGFPILLSNGNMTESGDLPEGRHFTIWHDPFPKPCYLFALVAGNLKSIHDTFTTMSGKKVDLYIHVNPGNENKCAHAMDSLKRSMKWDEEKYGREYDLNVFHIVAVNDFNFGAMENKSLNIFNSKLVLALPETATDADFLSIEAVIGHEYFHNWTGNRITCRDWFQLSLKEGLTVFRDQSFSADMNSAAVQRIDDVSRLRNAQFPEDAGPTSHPIRPDSYIEINNFYTPTVYEKGAEVIRMMHTLLGADNYRKGTDLYFERHDGQAVTCDDFVQCMQDASNVDLSQFREWYSQSGTPQITASGTYDAEKKIYALTLSQTIAAQPDNPALHLPVALGLLGKDGTDLLPEKTRILHLKEKEQTFLIDGIAENPVPSLFRDFSAPVKLESGLSNEDLLFLMAHDSDGFNRWDSGQTYLQRLILSFPKELPDAVSEAFGRLLADTKADKALLAKALSLPSEGYLAQLMETVDVDSIHAARNLVMSGIGKAHLATFEKLYAENADTGAYIPSPEAVGKRRLRAIALRYIQAADASAATAHAAAQYAAATNMSDKVTALSVLADTATEAAQEAFADFHSQWKDDPLVLDKWFALQAAADRADVPEAVTTLSTHPDFTYKNPNRLRSLISMFCANNQKWFHRADGAGYRLLADTVIKVNAINPSTAARLLTPMRQWKRFDTARRSLMETELKRILEQKDISNDVYEIVSKSLS